MSAFPHGVLTPADVTPRIKSRSAATVCNLIEAAKARGIGCFETPAAIIVAVFDGPLVRFLIDEQQVRETIKRLQTAIARGGRRRGRQNVTRTAESVECIVVYDDRGEVFGWVLRAGTRWQAICLDRGLLHNGGDYGNKGKALRAMGVNPGEDRA